MVNNFEKKDGSITFYKRDTDAKLKALNFKEGYLVKVEETFDSNDHNPMSIAITISAREISMNNASHVNERV